MYYFIGIGGIGMSGLAHMLLQKGYKVSGSDVAAGSQTESIQKAGGFVHIGHRQENVPADATVIYSTDIKKDNVEYVHAQNLNLRLVHRSQLLQQLMSECTYPLCVAGTHGKTTTSSLLMWVLYCAGKDPSYAIGGVIPQLKTNAGLGKGDFFVAEACESDGSFLNYAPKGVIITNIDEDHMDFYGTIDSLKDSFRKFIDLVIDSDLLFYCGDDPLLDEVAVRGVSYGFGECCQLRILEKNTNAWKQSFSISFRGKIFSNIDLNLAGKHNILNAAAVFGLCHSLGIEEGSIRKAMTSFGGALRRCERKGERLGVLFIDDYAHHPTEIKTTLAGIRASVGERRLIVAYQPHRYTRSKSCLGKYYNTFDGVDQLFVTEIYSAREKPIEGITTEKVVADICASNQCPSQFLERQVMAKHIADFVEEGDVVVTLGAGDITKLSEEIMECMVEVYDFG